MNSGGTQSSTRGAGLAQRAGGLGSCGEHVLGADGRPARRPTLPASGGGPSATSACGTAGGMLSRSARPRSVGPARGTCGPRSKAGLPPAGEAGHAGEQARVDQGKQASRPAAGAGSQGERQLEQAWQLHKSQHSTVRPAGRSGELCFKYYILQKLLTVC